jgi:transposase InsO family protein
MPENFWVFQLPTKQTAQLADEFTAMRRANKVKKPNFSQNSARSFQSTSGDAQPEVQNTVLQNAANFKAKPSFMKQDERKTTAVRDHRESAPPAATVKCAYCKKLGHTIQQCFKLKRKNENASSETVRAEPSQADNCLISTIVDRDNFDSHLREFVDPRYRPHCFEVTVVKPDRSELKLTCLRDTAALQSLVRDLSKSRDGDKTHEVSPSYISTDEYRQICGIGGTRINVPLVQVDLRSDIVSGMFEFGVCNNLPPGIDLLAGNDLFFSDDVNTCVITRSQAAAAERLAAEQQVSVSDPTVTDSNDVQLSENIDTASSRASQTGNDSQANRSLLNTDIETVPIESIVDRNNLIKLQQADTSLARYFEKIQETPDEKSSERFFLKSGVLMRKWHTRLQPPDTGFNQIVAPISIRRQLLYLSHDIPASAHLGVRKTSDRLLRHFWWGSAKSDVQEYVRTCHKCQCVGKGFKQVVAPLHSMPIVTEPWSICSIDIVGPLPVCKDSGNRFILTVMDLCTHYPEAIALKQHTARDVALALANIFSRVGFPNEILSDLGTDFTSELMQIFLHEFNIGHMRCSAYHAMTNGSVEKFNGCLKTSLKTLTQRFPDSWDTALCWILFGYREVVNETTGFSPFELMYGRSVKGPLTLIKDAMLQEVDLTRSKKNVVEFMLEVRENLRTALELSASHAMSQRSKAKVWYDRKARMQEFKPGDKVLMLLPIPGSPLQLKLHGPYEVSERLGAVDYVIHTPDRRKTRRVCHVNLLRPYRQRDLTMFPDISPSKEAVGVHVVVNDDIETNLPVHNDFDNIISAENLLQLSMQQQSELSELLSEFRAVFSDKPGRTQLCEHHIELVPDAKPVFCRPYRMPPDKTKFLKEEIAKLLELGIIEEAPSNGNTWASPVLLVPGSGNKLRLVSDMRQVNLRTVVDPYPLPLIEQLIDKVGNAKYLTKLDMVRGYWQVPLDSASIPICGFITPFGHYRWRFMPFGCRNAPATFSRLVSRLLADLEGFCVAFLDDILIFSDSWEDHKRAIIEVLQRVKTAGLTLNLSKSVFAVAELDYLGHRIGRGQIRPLEKKISALLQYDRPKNRKQLLSFLGLAGYYRRHLPNFSHTSAVLSNLLRKDVKFEWSEDAQKAFVDLKSRLGSRPILRPADYTKEFCMAVDTSAVAIGANLFQVYDGVEHPICYFSRKLDVHQQKYSTVEREALGLLLAVRAFSLYFGSSKVKVYVDHNPLVFLHKMCNHNQKLLRWCLELQQYNLDIHHRAGKVNWIPDLLSRSM